MQVIYLDQNAACFLAKANSDPTWQRIREILNKGFRNRKLICPLPSEGLVLVESAPLHLDDRKSVQTLFWELSEGVRFKFFTEISSELTLALIRPISHWSPWAFYKPIWAEMDKAAENVKAASESAKQRMLQRMNGFRSSARLRVRWPASCRSWRSRWR